MLALLGLLLSGCSAASPEATTPDPTASGTTPSGTGLVATLLQLRQDEGTHIINAELTNQGDHPITVTSVVLRSPVIAPLSPTPKDTTYAPGQIIDLPIEYGKPFCSRGDQDRSASIDVVLSGGKELSLPVDSEGQDWIDRLFDHDCALERVAAIATISFGTTFVPVIIDGDPYLSGDLVVQRPKPPSGTVGRAPLTVIELEGSVLVSFVPGTPSTLPVTLPPGTVATVNVPVLLGSSNRCDMHAFAESKQTFLLSAFVRTEEVQAQRVIVTPDKLVQRQTLSLISSYCAAPH